MHVAPEPGARVIAATSAAAAAISFAPSAAYPDFTDAAPASRRENASPAVSASRASAFAASAALPFPADAAR